MAKKTSNLGILTDTPHVHGARVVHGLQGGGPGLVDDAGRPWYLLRTWCGRSRAGRACGRWRA